MNMSKNQIVMCAIGGVTLVAAGVLGYLAFDSYSAKGEAVEEREAAVSSVQRLLRADVSPVKESELAYRKNSDTLAGWTEAALAAAAVGDRAVKAGVNPAAFKQKLVDEARALAGLPGGVDGRIMKDVSAFGFPEFVSGDKLPEQAMLPQLQRQWGDVCYMVEKLQSCGVVEVVKIAPVPQASQAAQPQKDEKPKKGKKKQKNVEEEKPVYTVEKYDVQFRAKPAALVKSVNALATCDRFIVIESMSMAREGDMIAAALGEGPKTQAAAAPQTSGGRRPRRPRRPQAAEQEQQTEEQGAEKTGIATDPEKESPFLVTMVVSTFDFGSAAKTDQAGEAGDAPAPAEAESPSKEDK